MDMFSQKILVQDPSANKYGWTDNIKVRYCYETLHDEKKTFEIIKQNTECLKYFLKRLLTSRRTNKFKHYMKSLTWTKEHKEFMNYLLYISVKFLRETEFSFLLDNYSQFFDKIDYKLISVFPLEHGENECSADAYDRLEEKLYSLAYPKELDTVSISSLESLHGLSVADNNRFMNWCVKHAVNNQVKMISNKQKFEEHYKSLPELSALFGYTYDKMEA